MNQFGQSVQAKQLADDANDVCGHIREVVRRQFSDKKQLRTVRIQYGGSVKPENIEELLSKEHIDGALVGGASLEPESFLTIIGGREQMTKSQ